MTVQPQRLFRFIRFVPGDWPMPDAGEAIRGDVYLGVFLSNLPERRTTMDWLSVQQVLRILLYSGGSFYFGKEFADGEMFQAAIGGAVAIGAFLWWLYFQTVTTMKTVK